MANRFLLLGAGVVLTIGVAGFIYARETGRISARETVIALEPDRDAELIAELETLTPSEGTVFYACSDGRAFAVVHNTEDGGAALTLDGTTRELSFVPVSEGRQYTDGELVLFTQGGIAAILIGETVAHESCRMVR